MSKSSFPNSEPSSPRAPQHVEVHSPRTQEILALRKEVGTLRTDVTKLHESLGLLQEAFGNVILELATQRNHDRQEEEKEKEPEIFAQKDSVNLTLTVNKAGAIMTTVSQHNKLDAFLKSIDPDLTGKARFYTGKAELKLSDIPEPKLALIMQDKRVKDNTNAIQRD